MNSVKWPCSACSPWVRVAQWTERPPARPVFGRSSEGHRSIHDRVMLISSLFTVCFFCFLRLFIPFTIDDCCHYERSFVQILETPGPLSGHKRRRYDNLWALPVISSELSMFFFLLHSVWRIRRVRWPQLCCVEWHPYRHHGLHCTSLVYWFRVQTNVGWVWVGK